MRTSTVMRGVSLFGIPILVMLAGAGEPLWLAFVFGAGWYLPFMGLAFAWENQNG